MLSNLKFIGTYFDFHQLNICIYFDVNIYCEYILIDIGANLTDEMYNGSYHGSNKHEPDLDTVLKRCWDGGMEKMIVTGGCFSDCQSALELANTDGT